VNKYCVNVIATSSSMLHYRVCSGDKYLNVLSPTAPNASYEDIDLNVVVEYSGPQLINSSVPLLFRYAGNPDINAISPKRIRNRCVCFILPTIFECDSCAFWFALLGTSSSSFLRSPL